MSEGIGTSPPAFRRRPPSGESEDRHDSHLLNSPVPSEHVVVMRRDGAAADNANPQITGQTSPRG
ncbi:hypothetical protein M407DRAFT_246670 [Tulasnella calospora MUT 4182]|uniref:Uncharacterized protein n=1 Tax=Tulasnella calospora MUT 4182 TaxID=1051891 RepID=A0A0C3Q3M6_9AGAM|nr:hypothetical protein M407DRAFT_246670 [Tulasnella calospora MUT 4182]